MIVRTDLGLEEYNIQLEEADSLPVIDLGKPGKPLYIPAELCDIEPGQHYFGKLGPKEAAAMLRSTNGAPGQRLSEWGSSRFGSVPATPLLHAFGVNVSSQMSAVPARELPAPKVTYASSSAVVQNGWWGLQDVQFHCSGKVSNWKILIVCDDTHGITPSDPSLLGFISAFVNKCRSKGLDLAPRPSTILETDQLLSKDKDSARRTGAVSQISRTIELFGDMQLIDFILILLPPDGHLYSGVKQLCDVKFGVHSQCLQLRKALSNQGREYYLASVAQKLNTNLGGINHLLASDAMGWLTEQPTILVGVDVTQPHPNSPAGTPSVVGVVASVDSDFVQFPASACLQKSRGEVSDAIPSRRSCFRLTRL